MFKNDWVRYGFGEHLVSKLSVNKPFIIDYSAATKHKSLNSPLDIAIENCWDIYRQHGPKINLMISGGVDSQAMAYAFKKSGVPNVRYIWCKYNFDLNSHDSPIDGFFKMHDINIEVKDFDIIDFHKNELPEWAETFQNHSPHILTHCKIASILNDADIVVSSGAIVSAAKTGKMTYSVFGLERYSEISGQPVIGFFMNYSPELVYSTSKILVPSDTYENKCKAYNKAKFPVIPQRVSTHGFERLKEYFDDTKITPEIRFKYRNEASQRPYDLLFRYPLKEFVNYSDMSDLILP